MVGGRGAIVALAAVGLAESAAWAGAVALAARGRNPLLAYNGAFAVAFCLSLAATWIVLARPIPERRAVVLGVILGFAILQRLILLTSTLALSDDLYRYIWDGRVIAAGIDPYRYSPDAPELARLRGPLWGPINQKAQHSPYPPAAEAIFALTYRVAPDSVKAQQVVAVLGDCLVVGALLLLLGRLRLPPERVAIYAWSPGPLLHFAHSAHNDAWMVAPLLLAVALVAGPGPLSPGRRAGSGAALALAALVKLVPLVAAPLLLRRWRAAGFLAFGLALAAGIAPVLLVDPAALAGLGTEAGEAVFNDSLHFVLARVAGRLLGVQAGAVALVTAALLAGAAALLAWRGGRDDRALARAVGAMLGLLLLVNAVVEPWYLTWLVPFVALFLLPGGSPLPFAPTPWLGWLWLGGAVQLTDLTYLGSDYARFWPVIRAVEYGPLFALLALAGWRRFARRDAAPPTAG